MHVVVAVCVETVFDVASSTVNLSNMCYVTSKATRESCTVHFDSTTDI